MNRGSSWMLGARLNGLIAAVAFAFVSALAVSAAAPWRTLKDCRLMPNAANDGDSFHVHANGEEYIFRLYYVDTPETDLSFKDRVQEQADYFGLSVEDTVRLGKKAAEFTDRQLRGHPFTIITRWQDAEGRSRLPRHYAFVIVNDKDLSEELVREGLARVFGVKVVKPDGTTTRAEEEKLLALQREAKAAHRGAWANATDTSAEPTNGLPRMPSLPTIQPHGTH